MKTVLLDTNFLLIPAQFKVDIFSEIDRICTFQYEIAVLDKTIDELNKIIKEQNRIVNITQSKDRYFIRFYDFGKDDINFNILSFNKVQPTEHNIITTKLFPYVKDDFEQSIKLAGFTSLKFGLNLKSDHFDIRTSKDLFIKAVKD